MEFITLIIMVVILGGFLFFTSRSEKKREATKMSFVDSLKPGDKVVTTFGLYGTIDSIADTTLVLKMLDGKSMLRIDKKSVEKLQKEKV
ncbi:MAG: preprotein translocase subunit YajC [Culicoidibacterales bacterium]